MHKYYVDLMTKNFVWLFFICCRHRLLYVINFFINEWNKLKWFIYFKNIYLFLDPNINHTRIKKDERNANSGDENDNDNPNDNQVSSSDSFTRIKSLNRPKISALNTDATVTSPVLQTDNDKVKGKGKNRAKQNERKMEQTEREALMRFLVESRKKKTGLNQYPVYQKPPDEFSDSYNINHPDFKPNQRMIMNNLCHIYSVHPQKVFKKFQYLNLLEKQKQISKLYLFWQFS